MTWIKAFFATAAIFAGVATAIFLIVASIAWLATFLAWYWIIAVIAGVILFIMVFVSIEEDIAKEAARAKKKQTAETDY